MMVTRRMAKIRRSAADIRKLWLKLEPELARHRKEHERKGATFTAITREEFEAKLKRVNSPIIVSQGWDNSAPPGGTIDYSVGVMNPDPTAWEYLAVAVAFGNRNAIVSSDEFLSSFDSRFPTYAKPATVGFALAAGAFTTQDFQVRIPTGVERTGYFGNCVLQQTDYLGVGRYLDRACFFFDVT